MMSAPFVKALCCLLWQVPNCDKLLFSTFHFCQCRRIKEYGLAEQKCISAIRALSCRLLWQHLPAILICFWSHHQRHLWFGDIEYSIRGVAYILEDASNDKVYNAMQCMVQKDNKSKVVLQPKIVLISFCTLWFCSHFVLSNELGNWPGFLIEALFLHL